MRKTTFVLAWLFVLALTTKLNAQTVNGIKLSEIKSAYIQIESFKPTFSSKIFIRLEYGQKVENDNDNLIKGDDGKNLEFNSDLDCLNKLKEYGYELNQMIINAPDKYRNGRTKYILKRS